MTPNPILQIYHPIIKLTAMYTRGCENDSETRPRPSWQKSVISGFNQLCGYHIIDTGRVTGFVQGFELNKSGTLTLMLYGWCDVL